MPMRRQNPSPEPNLFEFIEDLTEGVQRGFSGLSALPGPGLGEQFSDVARKPVECDILEADALEDMPHCCANGDPDLAEVLAGPRVLDVLGPVPAYCGQRPVEGADDIGDRDVAGVAVEPVTALGTALARDDA